MTNNIKQQNQINRLETLLQSMQQAISDEQWEHIQASDIEFRQLILNCCTDLQQQHHNKLDVSQQTAAVQQLLATHSNIQSQLIQQHEDVYSRLKKTKTQCQASQKYEFVAKQQ